ncbi:MAG TPA: SRPBCC family protein [Roseateles sp.]
MKALKLLLVLVVVLLALLVGGGLLLSPRFSLSRNVVINAAPDKIYALVADPRGWKAWSVWNRRDPAMAIEYSGPASGPGAVWAWRSKTEGDGRMTFTTAEPGRRLGYELFFPDFGTTSTGELRLEPKGGSTQLTWTMNGDMGANPVYRWMGLFMDKLVGPDFDAGLANLKALAEKP